MVLVSTTGWLVMTDWDVFTFGTNIPGLSN